uniref:Ankyrin repeat and zinc finger peptidyl tRNA hydrolase 1 n=1 Tax=Cyprinodon variegatus TaxID=28743 RepID=A0A3Q2DQK2_CYPVA
MTGGGHFAGAVFEGRQVLQHKTFHRYTVRAKRGTAQGLRDSQNRSHMAKSAGAALRRYNEAALVKDIQDLLLTWAEHLNRASAVFIRAPSYNKTIFFGGRGGPLQKKDPRIRSLPFATRRATFREVQRVHGVLSTVQVYGTFRVTACCLARLRLIMIHTMTVQGRTQTSTIFNWLNINADKLPAPGEENDESSEEEEEETQLEMVEVKIGTLDLRESEIYPSRRRKRRRKKKEQIKLHDQGCFFLSLDVDESVDYGLRDALFTACKVGDVGTNFTMAPSSLLNKPIDSSGFTLLHVAAAAAQKAVVRLLLDAGADPAFRDNKSRTPYIVAPDKDTRNVFRKYMGENPDRHDYSKAQIPGPLTAETESKKMEKKKAQRAQRKQREKEQKEEKRKQELEAEEKKRFASLTDREKSFLFDDRERCWSCGESLLGKIPFTYLDYSFCTPRCVQVHRKANAPPSKS